jgi:hypothetical protein
MVCAVRGLMVKDAVNDSWFGSDGAAARLTPGTIGLDSQL